MDNRPPIDCKKSTTATIVTWVFLNQMLKLEELQEMCQMFPSLPDPDIYPKTFDWYVKMYRYLKQQRKRNDNTTK